MKKIKSLVLLALCLCMVLSAAGCGASKELVQQIATTLSGDLDSGTAQLLVQNDLDSLYHNAPSDEYLTLVGITREEVEQGYWDGISAEIEFFASYFSIVEMPEDLHARLEAFYDAVYAKSSYTVGEPVRNENGSYTVPVTVQPIDIMSAIIDTVLENMEVLNAYTQEDIDAMSDEEYAQYETQWTEIVVEAAEANLENPGLSPLWCKTSEGCWADPAPQCRFPGQQL